MAKPKRGKSIKSTQNWRGTCPLCNRGGVRIVWDKTVEGQKLRVCKRCA